MFRRRRKNGYVIDRALVLPSGDYK